MRSLIPTGNMSHEDYIDQLLGDKSREVVLCSKCKVKPFQEILFGDLSAFENPKKLCIECLMKDIASRELSQTEIENAAKQSISSKNCFISVSTFLTENQKSLVKERALKLLEEQKEAKEKTNYETLIASVDELLREAGFGFDEVVQLDRKYKNLIGILLNKIDEKQDKSFSGLFG